MKIQILTTRYRGAALLGAVLLSATAVAVMAAEITGTPGSPSAMTETTEWSKTFFKRRKEG